VDVGSQYQNDSILNLLELRMMEVLVTTEVRSVSRRLPGCLPALRSVEPQAACRPPAGGAGGKVSRLVGVRCVQLRRQPGRRLPGCLRN